MQLSSNLFFYIFIVRPVYDMSAKRIYQLAYHAQNKRIVFIILIPWIVN